MANVRVGVIGLGIGKWHAESYQHTSGAELVALCDRDRRLLKAVGKDRGITRLYPRIDDMLADPDVDAVSVCLPNYLHARVSVAAMERGKHVLCEKPLAATVRGARDILRGMRLTGRTCMVAMKFRFTPEAHVISDYLRRGELGDPYYGCTHYLRPIQGIPTGKQNWFVKKNRSGGGALIDNGVHLLDLNWYLMGCPDPVFAFGSTYAKFGQDMEPIKKDFNVEDFGCGLIKFANGATIYLDNAWASMVESEVIGLRVLGTRGGATMWPFDIVQSRDGKNRSVKPPLEGMVVQTQFEHFIRCVQEGRPSISPPEQGLTMLKMLDAIYVSQKRGKAVPLHGRPE
jgi:predicted dehydrogenase